MFRNPLEERGGRVCNARNTFFFKKKSSLRALRAHKVCTYYARTPVVHRVHQCAACPSWGSPPWGLKTWVIGVVELRKVMEGALRALVHRTIKVVLVVTRRIGCFPGPLLFGLEECVKALLVSCPLPGGLQWACPTIPLCSGLRFRGWQGWSVRCCWWHRGSCSGGGGGRRGRGRGRGRRGAVVVGGGERCDGRSGCITSHFLPLRPALEGTNVPSANGCFLLLGDTKAMWNGIVGMEGGKMGGHTVQPNRGCALGAAMGKS